MKKKMQRAVHITTGGKVELVQPHNGKEFSLEELQAFVGGHIEHIRIPHGRYMYCNEEGKLNGLGVNLNATKISGIFPHDIIVGDAVVMGRNLDTVVEELARRTEVIKL